MVTSIDEMKAELDTLGADYNDQLLEAYYARNVKNLEVLLNSSFVPTKANLFIYIRLLTQEEFQSLRKLVLIQIQKLGISFPQEHALYEKALSLLSTSLDIAESLSFEDVELKTTLLINCIEHAKIKGWESIYDEYHAQQGKAPVLILDTIRDYIATVFASRLLHHIHKLGDRHPLYIHLVSESSEWFTTCSTFYEMGARFLCDKKDITELAILSSHWHEPLQQTAFAKIKTYTSSDTQNWPSLFQTKEDNQCGKLHKELLIPAEITSEAGWEFVARTSPEELNLEGATLNHCVGGYSSKCLLENSHIVSIVDPRGNGVSTIEFTLNGKCLQTAQHFAKKNSPPSDQAQKAHQWLTKSIKKKEVYIDYDYLEEQRRTRTPSNKFEDTVCAFVGFDPFGQAGMKRIKKAEDVYLSHTPPTKNMRTSDFKKNIKSMIRSEKVDLHYVVYKRSVPTVYTVTIRLISEEQQHKNLKKAERAERWKTSRKPRQWELNLTSSEKKDETQEADEKKGGISLICG